MGPVRLDTLKNNNTTNTGKKVDLYFISLTDVAMRYAYVTPLKSQEQTERMIDKFLKN